MITRTVSGTSDRFSADVRVPGDKSLSHRALLFAGMAEGDSVVSGLGYGLDIASTAMALRALGVRRVFGPCAVGSLTPELGPGAIVVPDQLVDRTRGRGDTYFDSGGIHVGFADPYCPTLRAAATGLPGVVDGGTMVVVQGPRFSTRAESIWFAREGFTLINMTGYPEAVLARELEMCYAAIALVTDLDAGIETGGGVRAIDVFAEFEKNLVPFKKLVHEAIDQLTSDRVCTHCLAHEGVELPFDLP